MEANNRICFLLVKVYSRKYETPELVNEVFSMRKSKDIVKLRFWCVRRREEGVTVNEICASAQIPRRTFYNWWSRYRLHGMKGLNPLSKAPHTVHRIDPAIAEKVAYIRRDKCWGPRRISRYLRTQGVKLGSTTAYRILRRSGLNRPSAKAGVRSA
jgi:transposase